MAYGIRQQTLFIGKYLVWTATNEWIGEEYMDGNNVAMTWTDRAKAEAAAKRFAGEAGEVFEL